MEGEGGGGGLIRDLAYPTVLQVKTLKNREVKNKN